MKFIEKRKSPRIILDDVTVEVYRSAAQISEPELTDICTVMNISENGMLFIAHNLFEPGQLLRLTFLLPDSFVIIRTDALTIRTVSSKGSHETGVQFKNLGLAERKLISHFVNKALGSEAPAAD